MYFIRISYVLMDLLEETKIYFDNSRPRKITYAAFQQIDNKSCIKQISLFQNSLFLNYTN